MSWIPLVFALFFPWEDLLVEVLFMAAIWVPLMFLENWVEVRSRKKLIKMEHELSRELMHESHILQTLEVELQEDPDEDVDSGCGDGPCCRCCAKGCNLQAEDSPGANCEDQGSLHYPLNK